MTINKFTFKDGETEYSTTNSEDKHESLRNGKPFGLIDFNTASREVISAYCQGLVDEMVSVRNFEKNNPEAEQNNNVIDMQNAFGNQDNNPNFEGTGMGNSNQTTHAKQKVLVPPGGRSPYQPQSYEQYPNDNPFSGNMAAFSDRILIAILGSFGLGVIAATVYIFINLGKVTINL